MAYASKELKAKVVALIKAEAKAMNVKLGFSAKIVNYDKLIVNIRSCSVDLVANHKENVDARVEKAIYGNSDYDLYMGYKNAASRGDIRFNKDRPEGCFSGEALEIMNKVRDAVKCEYYDNSEIMRDYISHAYYYDIRIGDSDSGFKVA